MPVVSEDDQRRLLKDAEGEEFEDGVATAIIRLFHDTEGAWPSSPI